MAPAMIDARFRRLLAIRTALGAMVLALALAAPCRAQSWAWDDGTVPFVVSPEEIVDRMLRIADVGKGDYLIDLGSGDGRIVIGAAQRGARALGIDIDPSLVERGRENARAAGVAGRTEFVAKDLFETDLGAASVITMYLLPEVNLKLRPRLLALNPGTRLVSHDWDMGEWEPDETILLRTPEKPVGLGGKSRVYLWIVPADMHGNWTWAFADHGGQWRFDIGQQFQAVRVQARAGRQDLVVRATRLRGREIRMLVTGLVDGRAWNHFFKGTIEGDEIRGEVLVSNGERQRTLPWIAKKTR